MVALAIPASVPLVEAIFPLFIQTIAGATAAAEAAAVLPAILPVATAASGLSVLAAGAALYDWRASQIEASRNIARARYCSGTPGANGCPVIGSFELTIQTNWTESSNHFPLVDTQKRTVRAPYSIVEGSYFGSPAWLLRTPDGDGLLNYKEYSEGAPQIVLAQPAGPGYLPWEKLAKEVRDAMAATLTRSDARRQVSATIPTSLYDGQIVGGSTILVYPDGEVTGLGEDYRVGGNTAPPPDHPFDGPAPQSPPRPGGRVAPGAGAGVGAGAGSPGAIGAGAGAGSGSRIGAGASAGALPGSSSSSLTGVGAGVGTVGGTASLSAPAVGAGVRSPSVSGGQRVTVGSTTTYTPTTNAKSFSSKTVTSNTFAPTVNAPTVNSPASALDLAAIGAAIGTIPLAVGAVMTPAIAKIPDVAGVTAAAATGSCQALNGQGPCSASNPIGKIREGLGALGTKLDALDIAGNAALGAQIAALEANLVGKLGKIGSAINSDRALMLVTYVTTLHNAYMLSSNLTQTLFSVASNSINAIMRLTGLQSASDEQIDVDQSISNLLDESAKGMFGVTTWEGIKAQWKAYNRIYQATANVLFTVQGLFDAARSISELAAENTGRIGNALKKWGVVGEKAFGWMPERVNHTSAFQRKWDNIKQSGENIEQAASVIDSVSGNVVGILDGADQLVQTRKELDDAVKAATPKPPTENLPVKTAVDASKAVSVSPPITDSNLVKPGA